MNARQKAKHYKKLYEQAKVPYHTVYFTEDTLDHYTITSALTEREIETHSLNCKEILTYRIADQLKENLQHFIEFRKRYPDPNDDRAIMYARLDFWVRKDK